MSRRLLLLAALAAMPLGPAGAREPPPPPAAGDSLIRNSVGFVQGRIDGHGPYWFLVDTGANRSALDDGVAETLGLLIPGTTAVEGNAGIVETRQARIGRLEAAGFAVDGLRPTVSDLSGSLAPEGQSIAGILGVDAFGGQAALFDLAAGRVAFAAQADALAPLRGATELPFTLDNGIPAVEARIDGLAVRLRIDSGASIGDGPATFVNVTDSFFRRLQARDPTLQPYTHFTAIGTGGEIRIPVVKARSLELGGATAAEPRLIVQPPAGYFGRSDALGFLGAYAFKAWSGFIVDYPRRRLILLPKRR